MSEWVGQVRENLEPESYFDFQVGLAKVTRDESVVI